MDGVLSRGATISVHNKLDIIRQDVIGRWYVHKYIVRAIADADKGTITSHVYLTL